jgi:hypothetical protein
MARVDAEERSIPEKTAARTGRRAVRQEKRLLDLSVRKVVG